MPRPLWTPFGEKAKRHRLPKNKRAVQIASRLSRSIFSPYQSSFHPFPIFHTPFVPPVRRYILFFPPPLLSRLSSILSPSIFLSLTLSLSLVSIIHREQHANKRAKGLHGGKSRERDTRYSLNIAVLLFLAIMGRSRPWRAKGVEWIFWYFFSSLSLSFYAWGSREKN